MKPWHVVVIAILIVGVAFLGFYAGQGAKGGPGIQALPSNEMSCDETLNMISTRLYRPHKLSPCTDAGMQVLSSAFGAEVFNKKRSGSITVYGIAAVSVSEFDLSIASGREGMAKLLSRGEMGQRAYKVNANNLASFMDVPYFFKTSYPTAESQKILDDYRIDAQTAKWLESAPEAEVQKLRDELKAELIKAAGL